MAKNRSQKTPSEVAWVIQKMTDYGSFDHSRQLICHYIAEAKAYFSSHLDFLSVEPYRSHILSFIDFLSCRES